MKKGIYLQMALDSPGEQDPAALQALVTQVLGGDHKGLHIEVKKVQGAEGTHAPAQGVPVLLYIEGEQAPADNFEALATGIVRELWQGQQAPPHGAASMAEAGHVAGPRLVGLTSLENYSEDEEQVTARPQREQAIVPIRMPAYNAPSIPGPPLPPVLAHPSEPQPPPAAPAPANAAPPAGQPAPPPPATATAPATPVPGKAKRRRHATPKPSTPAASSTPGGKRKRSKGREAPPTATAGTGVEQARRADYSDPSPDDE